MIPLEHIRVDPFSQYHYQITLALRRNHLASRRANIFHTTVARGIPEYVPMQRAATLTRTKVPGFVDARRRDATRTRRPACRRRPVGVGAR